MAITGKKAPVKKLDDWHKVALQWCRLEQTQFASFGSLDQIPAGRKTTCLRLVVADRPMKENPRRVRFTAGGDRINYPGDCRTKTADLTTAKILFNSVISTPDARFMTLDIKDFCLNTDVPRCEHMRTPVSQMPDKIMQLCNLAPLVHKGEIGRAHV